jgi:hypothetical protein
VYQVSGIIYVLELIRLQQCSSLRVVYLPPDNIPSMAVPLFSPNEVEVNILRARNIGN